ncbi:MAG: hypothetical protein A2283_11065 [Lentisphaerae bacterium RIFOXYA12_FULL_48_11]|nr:MAG: hypothetical protein A2283_11065 [Lentisphaerae bacterium RIFOXYA12_FULL_48_11]
MLCVFLCVFLSNSASAAQEKGKNLMINGNCEDPENPWKYWTYDYTPSQNGNYINNTKYITMLPQFNSKKNVIRLIINDDKGYQGFPMWQLGVQVDSPLIPFEQGCRYRFSILVQGSAPYHCYPIGYQFKPGLAPYENPSLFDMQKRWKGSWNTIDDKGVNPKSWTKIHRDFPEPQLSNNGMRIIKTVRYMSFHFIGITGEGVLYIKDLTCEKLPDGYKGGKINADDNESEQTPRKPAAGKTGK